jgi:hypothetical protein
MDDHIVVDGNANQHVMNRLVRWHIAPKTQTDGEAFTVSQFAFNVPQAIVTQIAPVSNFAVVQMAAWCGRG